MERCARLCLSSYVFYKIVHYYIRFCVSLCASDLRPYRVLLFCVARATQKSPLNVCRIVLSSLVPRCVFVCRVAVCCWLPPRKRQKHSCRREYFEHVNFLFLIFGLCVRKMVVIQIRITIIFFRFIFKLQKKREYELVNWYSHMWSPNLLYLPSINKWEILFDVIFILTTQCSWWLIIWMKNKKSSNSAHNIIVRVYECGYRQTQ